MLTSERRTHTAASNSTLARHPISPMHTIGRSGCGHAAQAAALLGRTSTARCTREGFEFRQA
jgi:hypothetical protein